jgi:hypothetical protein
MKIISLGGIGGCDLAEALRKLNQPTYPYDWLITTQSFIIDSFNDFNSFFTFDEKYVYDNEKLLVHNKKAIMLHDFNNFTLQKCAVIQKYERRFNRLNDALMGNEDILFVRIYDNLQEKLVPIDYYNNILSRDEEDMQKWEDFIHCIKNKYNKNAKLLVITSIQDMCSKTYNNIIINFTHQHKNCNSIYKIIQDTMPLVI